MRKREGKLRNLIIESRYLVFVPAPRHSLKPALKNLTGAYKWCAGDTMTQAYDRLDDNKIAWIWLWIEQSRRAFATIVRVSDRYILAISSLTIIGKLSSRLRQRVNSDTRPCAIGKRIHRRYPGDYEFGKHIPRFPDQIDIPRSSN